MIVGDHRAGLGPSRVCDWKHVFDRLVDPEPARLLPMEMPLLTAPPPAPWLVLSRRSARERFRSRLAETGSEQCVDWQFLSRRPLAEADLSRRSARERFRSSQAKADAQELVPETLLGVSRLVSSRRSLAEEDAEPRVD